MGHGANMTAVFVAAIAAWIFGAVYYGVLCRAWVAAQGKTAEQCKAEAAGKSKVAFFAPFVLSFIAEIVMAWAMYGVLFHMSMLNPRAGAISGAACWLGFVLTTITVNNAYAGRKAMLTAIDSVHWLGVLVIIGAIVGWFGA